MSLSLTLRLEQPADHRAVEELTREALPPCRHLWALERLAGLSEERGGQRAGLPHACPRA